MLIGGTGSGMKWGNWKRWWVKCCEISYNWALPEAIEDGGDKVTLRKGICTSLQLFLTYTEVLQQESPGLDCPSLSLFIWPEERTTSLFVREWTIPFRTFFYTEYIFTHTTLFPSPYLYPLFVGWSENFMSVKYLQII
jgi:hypothetical protein